MLRAMSTAATGMEAQELKIDLIANNLANVNTAGFKKSRGEFQDLLYETLRTPGTTAQDGTQVPTGLQVGQGVRSVATLRQFTMGDLKQTGGALDVAIEGSGFLQVRQPSGEIAYTRDGELKTDAQGRLVTADGLLFDPPIVIPADATSVAIGADGTVSVTRPNNTQPVEVGRLELAVFANPAGLLALGKNLYAPSAAAGEPILAQPGTQGVGTLAQGMLEMSNVKVVEEMVDLIAAQRAYETNSKVIEAADEMLRTTSSLR
jgi:flagellar basal-body rod protein FlgG